MTYFIRAASFTVLFSILLGSAHAGSARQPSTVVELFTSQGCSSCPPADSLLGKLVKNPDVLGLSYAVTYWDYIGWRDIFGSLENDERQAQYRDRMNASYVYTPQMIIAGIDHFVGSNKGQLEDNLLQFHGHAQVIPLKWQIKGTELKIELPASKTNATIWQMDIDHARQVKIGRGENTGKSITYHNIVRNMKSLASWDGERKTLSLDLQTLQHDGRDGCAILIQENGYGPILAALIIEL